LFECTLEGISRTDKAGLRFLELPVPKAAIGQEMLSSLGKGCQGNCMKLMKSLPRADYRWD